MVITISPERTIRLRGNSIYVLGHINKEIEIYYETKIERERERERDSTKSERHRMIRFAFF